MKVSGTIPEWAGQEINKMGILSRNEIIMTILACLALLLWIFGNSIDINPTVSAMVILCLMVLFKIISWNDIVANKAAWNIFLWFGALVTLADGLN